jgi:hypothetical protein
MKITLLAVASLLLAPTTELLAASSGAAESIYGVVVDSTGGFVPGATVAVKSKETGATRRAVTDLQGSFAVPGLQAGSYTVTISMPGFSDVVVGEVKLLAGTPYEVNATLEIGGLTENVIVDAGWSANDTLSASRIKQALKDVPVAIDAITADFAQDLGLHTADEITPFVANVSALPIMENDNQKGNFSFRGLSQGNSLSRNYFRWYVPSDTYNVERIDFGKGSNSLIFGDGEPGGNGAVFTKRPLPANHGGVVGYYNSNEGYRALIDLNRRVRPGLDFRLNAITREEKTFQDASGYKFDGVTLAALWQPGKSTAIRLEGEWGDYSSARGFAGIFVREQSARGRGYGTSGTYFTSDGVWIQQALLPAIDRGATNGPAGGEPSLIAGDFFNVQLRNAAGVVVGTKRIDGFPMSYNIRGSFDNHSRPFHTVSATWEQLAGPVSFELAYNYQYQSEERNDNNFDQTISVDVNGRPYIDTALDRKHFTNSVHAFRGSAFYKLDGISWMQQTLVATAEYREDQALNTRWQYFNIAPFENGLATAINTTADRGRLRIYLDDPAFYSRALFDRVSPGQLPVTNLVNMVPLKFFATGNSSADGTEWRQTYAASLLATGRYFGGRLQSLVGFRYDAGRTDEYIPTRKEGRFNEDIVAPGRRSALPGDYVEVEELTLDNTSFTGGLTFGVTKDVNAYAVYSESFRFQANRTFERERIGPIEGATAELGLKGDFFARRLSVSLGVFHIDRENVVLSWNNIIGFDGDETEDLMNPNNVLPGDPGYKYRESGTASASRNYTATESSKGFDVTLMARPVKGLQLRFVLGRADVSSEPNLGSFRAYYDAAVLRPDESPGMLTEARLLLDTLDVQSRAVGSRGALWSAGWVADYGFSRGSWAPLQGLRLGINGSWRDNYLFGTPLGVELTGGASHLVNAYAMRDQAIWGQQVRFRVGVRNLTDFSNDFTRPTSFTTMSDGSNVYRYSYVMPRQYEFELGVKF